MNEKIIKTAKRLVDLCTEKQLTVCTAESCTGGLICAAITDIPGASAVLSGGIVSYAVSVKEDLLGVAPEIIDTCGVVSEKCAEKMALGAAKKLGTDLAVSVTGIAGPGGGTEDMPVGTVCFGICCKEECRTFTRHFPSEGGRGEIRSAAVLAALEALEDAANNF